MRHTDRHTRQCKTLGLFVNQFSMKLLKIFLIEYHQRKHVLKGFFFVLNEFFAASP